METIPALVIALLAAIFITLPFFIRTGRGAGDEYFPDRRAEKLKDLNSRKDALLTAIKDIEFDYGLGKLTKDDFEELHGKYRMEAASLLKEIDTLAGAAPPGVLEEDDLEKEIRAERSKFLMPHDDEEIEKEILRAREASWARDAVRYCTKCGTASGEEDLFCSKCGAKLKPITENTNARTI